MIGPLWAVQRSKRGRTPDLSRIALVLCLEHFLVALNQQP
jgi:hypothetical protein